MDDQKEDEQEQHKQYQDSDAQRIISKWKMLETDYMDWSDLSKDCKQSIGLKDYDDCSDELKPHPGDKLSGYPRWIQYSESAVCKQCNKEMKATNLLFQLSSYDIFGDAGCGFIQYCDTCNNQVGFFWQCC